MNLFTAISSFNEIVSIRSARVVACIFAMYTIIVGATTQELRAQMLDSAKIQVGTMVTVASQDYQPLWLVSQRWGTISDQSVDVTSYLQFHNSFPLGSWTPIQDYGRILRKRSTPSVSYGFSVYNNQLFQQTRLQEGYLKLNLSHWQLAAGRYQEIIGEVPSQISSGSLGISGNAVPIPKVSLGLPRYTDVPFIAPGWVQVKGQASVGWMEEDAFVDKAKFHHRSLYFQVGKRAVISRRTRSAISLFGGMNQFVIWGGEHPENGQLPGRIQDLARFIVPGNNLGFFDYGFTLLTRGFKFRGYTQSPFEGKGSINPFRIKDRMAGLVVSDTRKGSFFPDITIEAINTTWRDPNPEGIAEEDDYDFYNNFLYADGWSYNGRILGTPLFFDRSRAEHYFGTGYASQEARNWNIANNSINGVHIGLKGYLIDDWTKLSYRTLFTHTINNGNYRDENWVEDGKKGQSYLMQELTFQLNPLKINGALGVDVGNLTNNVGGMLGVEYDLNFKPDLRDLGPVRYKKRMRSGRRRGMKSLRRRRRR